MASQEKIMSFPHMGNYHVAIEFLLRHVLDNIQVFTPPPITKKTLELGSKYSPDFVCVPFKYNLGNYLEALEQGANILVQSGGGCRFGYYGEIQEQILRDLGYDFEFISLIDNEKVNPIAFFSRFKRLNPQLSFARFAYYFQLTFKMIEAMDSLDHMIRSNIGFAVREGSFELLQKEFLRELPAVEGFRSLDKLHRKYDALFRQLEVNKPENPLRVGIVGELYTLMEPFSSCFIEKELAKKGIQVTRFITVSYLLRHHPKSSDLLKLAGNYLEYEIGADGTDSVARAKILAEAGYDGVIHVKPFGCTPEVNSMPMMQNISNDYKMPILYFSFDAQTSETGVLTRLEAFHDMLMMRREGNTWQNVI
ncbi:hypothetical protein [Desulfitobacterium chlororespirans]|uniref:Predicted nucleotide-binding protein, sugar kinase/HSP70/actin superfamily n=1 Tax=Desulfitobacterium chlororespirans DSM 11544 TaxID=1121395 RepID=A0A1M7RZ28_9FIRM|nr:hypothetical protein [Desulfitobacterium chlororespirans]SHN51384.1 Predicted nucleotide-binding protein, sugar kinase/HSP70/actin superfamily [Desulfitobacterium chlororespirans DSM 11544]